MKTKRTAEWDVGGLTVACPACFKDEDRCDDCDVEYDRVMAEYTTEALELYGRPYAGWQPSHEDPSVEQRLEWLRLKS